MSAFNTASMSGIARSSTPSRSAIPPPSTISPRGSFRWRAWLTHAVISRWLANGRYYQLNLVGGDHENPEYRIAEDLRIATESPVDFVAGVTAALLSAATFIVVLWTIGGALSLTLGGMTISIPGFLVIAPPI